MGTLESLTDQERLKLALGEQAKILRNLADEDYLTARLAYRHNLLNSFLTSAQQAVEKYLKAILLFNEKSVREFSHQLNPLFSEVESLGFVCTDLPPRCREFITVQLANYGFNRYLENPSVLMSKPIEPALIVLDETVWSLRRFCQNLRSGAMVGRKLTYEERQKMYEESFQSSIKYLTSVDLVMKRPNTFKILGGFLEKAHKGEVSDDARTILIWKNFFYGERKKKKIQNFTSRNHYQAGAKGAPLFDLAKTHIRRSRGT